MAKKLNTLGIVFTALAAVGLILAIVGMCTGIVSMSYAGESESLGLFSEDWKMFEAYESVAGMLGLTIPNRTFTIIAFVVALIGIAVVLVNVVLGILGKDNKILGLVGGALAILGGILVLVAGLVLAGQFNSFMEDTAKLAGSMGGGSAFPTGMSFNAGLGIWVGAIGGILAGVAGLLGALKVGQKA